MKNYSLASIGTSHTCPILKDGENVYINFVKLSLNDPLSYFFTNDKELQKAIEASNYFKNREIKLVGNEIDTDEIEDTENMEDGEEAKKIGTNVVINKFKYPQVKTFQQAKNILISEPFNIPKKDITPQNILNVVNELGFKFPNLKMP